MFGDSGRDAPTPNSWKKSCTISNPDIGELSRCFFSSKDWIQTNPPSTLKHQQDRTQMCCFFWKKTTKKNNAGLYESKLHSPPKKRGDNCHPQIHA